MGKYTKYPNQIDTASELPLITDLVTPVVAEVVNRIREAVLAIESELGIQPSGVFGNVRDRLLSVDSTLNTIQNDIQTINDELGPNPSGPFATVVDRLDSLTSDVSQLLIDVSFALSELGSNPSGSFVTIEDRLNDVDSTLVSLAADIAALETELGTNPSGTFTTVADRLNNIESDISSIVTGSNQPTIIPLAYNEEVDVDGYTIIGATQFNPSDYLSTGRTIVFIATIYTSNVSVSAQLRLVNQTDGYVVSGTEFTSSSLSPVRNEAILDVPTDLPNSDKRYEVQLRMSTASSGNSVFCERSEFLIKWS